MRVSYSLLILCLFFSFNKESYALTAPELEEMLSYCTTRNSAGKNGWDLIIERAQKGQVESLARRLSKNISSGCMAPLTPEYTAQALEQLEQIRKFGLNNEIKKRVKAIKHHSQHQSVQKNFDELQAYLFLAGEELGTYIGKEEKQQLIQRGDAIAKSRKSTCTNIDHRSRLRIPARNQAKVGWCYAFTAADLLSYHFGMNASAMDVASTYIQKTNFFAPLYESGGFVGTAIKHTWKKGFCLESEIPSENFGFALNASTFDQIESFFDEFESLNTRGMFSNLFNHSPTREQIEYVNAFCPNGGTPLGIFFPTLDTQNLAEILARSGRKGFWNELIEKSCTRRKSTSELKLTHQTSNHPGQITQIIDGQLDNRNIVGISYNAGILTDDQHIGNDSNHASSIVARRFNEEKQQCEYLLRNSWGQGTASYNSAYDVEAGHIWISEGVLTNAVKKIDYLERDH